MGRNETVELSLRARLDDLRKELGKVPGITSKEARSMAKALEKEIKAAERAAGKAAEETKGRWNRALKSIQFGALAIGAARAAKDIFRVVDGVAEYRQEIAKTSKTTGLATETIAGMQLAADSVGVSLEEVMKAVEDPKELQAFVDMTKEFGTDVGPEAIQSAKDWKIALSEVQMVLQDTSAELADFLDVDGLLRGFATGFVFAKEFVSSALDDIATRGVDSMKVLKLALTGNWEEAAILAQRYREMGTLTEEAWKEAEKAALEFYQLGEATRALEVPLENVAEREKAAAKEAAALTKELRAQGDATDQLRDIATEAQADQLSAEEKIQAALEEKIRQVLELGTTSQDYAQVLETVAALEQRAIRDTNALREEAQAEQLKRIEELAEANREAHEARNEQMREEMDQIQELLGALAGFADALKELFAFTRRLSEDRVAQIEKELAAIEASQDAQVDGAKDAARESLAIGRQDLAAQEDLRQTLKETRAEALRAELEEVKKQALKLWQAEQAAAISSVVFNTAAAIMAAFAQLGPIAGGIAAAALGVTGGVQIGTILAEDPPKFHAGRVPQLSPTETAAILDRHEGVANRRAMSTPGFRDQLEAANRGVVPAMGAEHTTVVLLNDRVLDVIVSRGMRGQGAQLEVKRVAAGAGSRRRRGGYG